jgi:hypothetical protein
MGSNPSKFKGPKNPVEQVSWHDCQAFLDKLNEKQPIAGVKFGLPTEAQWEYACRAGSATRYCFGDDEKGLGDYAWHDDGKSGRQTHPVGEKKPNAWGLYDMPGNVYEWCADWYDVGYYAKSSPDDPPGPVSGSDRVFRGGGWSILALGCRSAGRGSLGPGNRTPFLGFRVSSLLPAQQSGASAKPDRGPVRETAPRTRGGQLVESGPFAGLDRELVGQITAWKKGTPPPDRLLYFPKGNPPPRLYGSRALGTHVQNYVSRISDDELLTALLFHPRADAACERAAGRRLLELRGVTHVRQILAERRKTNPDDFIRTELATLTELLTSPYLRFGAASLDKQDATKEQTEKSLASLKAGLAKGVPWEQAYQTAADLLLDKRGPQTDGEGRPSLLHNRYHALISPTGFDVLERYISNILAPDHIRALFETKVGVYRMETADEYWFYYVEAFHE